MEQLSQEKNPCQLKTIIEDTTPLVDGHYEVGLLWKHDEPRLPSNRDMASQRSESLRRRLTKSGNEEMAAKYREVMDGYINKGLLANSLKKG